MTPNLEIESGNNQGNNCEFYCDQRWIGIDPHVQRKDTVPHEDVPIAL
jgi:hypothetical protein